MREQHLDFLAITPGLRKGVRLGERTSDIACRLLHIAHDATRRHVRTAFWFERTVATLQDRREVANAIVGADMAGRGERLPRRAGIDVALHVIGEVLSRERPILTFGLVDDRNVRRDAFLVDESITVRR